MFAVGFARHASTPDGNDWNTALLGKCETTNGCFSGSPNVEPVPRRKRWASVHGSRAGSASVSYCASGNVALIKSASTSVMVPKSTSSSIDRCTLNTRLAPANVLGATVTAESGSAGSASAAGAAPPWVMTASRSVWRRPTVPQSSPVALRATMSGPIGAESVPMTLATSER